jgi:hypothetical protein
MSHFTSLKTNISELDLLIKTLDNLKINWSRSKILSNQYTNELHYCDIIIEQQNGHSIGFSKIKSSYKLIYDEMFWQQPITISSFKDQLNVYYSLNLVTNNLINEGFEITNKVTENDYGNIKIKLNALRYN